MAAPKTPAASSIYQLKVTLKDSRPLIWRRLLVPADITLPRLHRALQEAMGWYDMHLHQFIVDGIYYGPADPEFPEDGMTSERRVRLNKILPNVKDRLIYEYDFGESWEHEIVVEKILPAEPGAQYPVCIAGQRACPPEDCGGLWGYKRFLAVIRNPNHPEHEDMLRWAGERFDPEGPNFETINERLKRIR